MSQKTSKLKDKRKQNLQSKNSIIISNNKLNTTIMAVKTIAGAQVNVSEEGYLEDMDQWNENIAKEIASEIGIELTDKHFEVLNYLREKTEAGEALTIRKVGKSGITDIKGLYKLFPKGPLKFSSKIAGIPKPASCV
jgi:tRNA 2-thiouridine synthesizing protein E